jgi:arabinan endo-1,5-alpha-L-arabinosidase
MVFQLFAQALLLTSLATSSPVFKRSFPDPEPMTGEISGFVHDPSVIRRDDGTYFLFTTNNRTNIASAPSMSGPWKHLGPALPNGSIIDLPGHEDIWAPDVMKLGDTYYLYYSVSDWGAQNASDIGVATSKTLEPNSWTDHGSIGIPADQRYNRIDPNLFRETAISTPLLAFGSFHDNIFQYPMDDPPLHILPDTPYTHLQQNTTRQNAEGPYQFRWRLDGQDFYYLFFSGGACCNAPDKLEVPGEEYRISVCRSTSSSGGFRDKEGRDCVSENGGTMVYASHGDVYAPGGQGVFYDPGQGAVVLYYHYVKPSIGYEYEKFFFGWNKLDFTSGWPVVVG